MPYINHENRQIPRLIGLGAAAENAGDLNYIFTVIIKEYFHQEGKGNYQAINDIVGALEGAKAEFQRRVVGPYEDSKIISNGDVY